MNLHDTRTKLDDARKRLEEAEGKLKERDTQLTALSNENKDLRVELQRKSYILSLTSAALGAATAIESRR